MKNSQNAGPCVPIPTNRQLTISLIGSIIRFAIEVPQVLRRRENLSPDKLLFLLLPIVRNLGKLIDRIRHSSSVAGRNASNGSGRFAPSRGDRCCPHASNAAGTSNRFRADNGTALPPPRTVAATATNAMWQARQQVSAPLNLQRQRQQQQPCSMTSMLMSDEDDESSVGIEMHRGESPALPGPRRQVLRQKDGNYAIRETTDTRGADGTFQRITKTISGPDVMILTNITSQLSELPTLMPRAIVRDSVRPAEK
ncbi:uncharacterized protein LOC126563412 [Anopheles maculipalpis]|uniref:uncharacterized protein LOC126563412 n=1 Tax=Anopheles maculipalpis TaxID=1496333 RepID=UPI002158D7F4|nr:uncharacterized protein LOC126563412 [Anopheles maculipalpis]